MGFKENAQNANRLLDEAIINIIVGFSKKESGEKQRESILELITEAQDHMFDNQYEIQSWMTYFQQKMQENEKK